MRDDTLRRIEALGLSAEDFKPKKDDKERIKELEQIVEEQSMALMELAEILSEVIE